FRGHAAQFPAARPGGRGRLAGPPRGAVRAFRRAPPHRRGIRRFLSPARQRGAAGALPRRDRRPAAGPRPPMYPLPFGLRRVPALLVADGTAAARRLAQLDEAGAKRLRIFSTAPDPTLEALARSRLERRLPSAEEIAAARLLFIADLPTETAERLAGLAEAA